MDFESDEVKFDWSNALESYSETAILAYPDSGWDTSSKRKSRRRNKIFSKFLHVL